MLSHAVVAAVCAFWGVGGGRGGDLLTGSVCQEGDIGAFETDTRDEPQRGEERKRPSFM